MVKKMAEDHNIQMDENVLVREAFAFQMRNGTLSGRCAEQFIKYLIKIIVKKSVYKVKKLWKSILI